MEETEWNKKIKNLTDRINDASLLGRGWKNLRVKFFSSDIVQIDTVQTIDVVQIRTCSKPKFFLIHSLGVITSHCFLRVELSDNSTQLFFNFPSISDFYKKVYLYELAICNCSSSCLHITKLFKEESILTNHQQ